MTSIITGSNGFIAKKLIEKLQSIGEDFLPLNREHGDLSICPLEDLIHKENDINNIFHCLSSSSGHLALTCDELFSFLFGLIIDPTKAIMAALSPQYFKSG